MISKNQRQFQVIGNVEISRQFAVKNSSCITDNRLFIHAPTGAGKTIIIHHALKNAIQHNLGCIILLVAKLVHTKQHLKDIKQSRLADKAQLLLFQSEDDKTNLQGKIENTTNVNKLILYLQNAKKSNKSLVVVMTYKSFFEKIIAQNFTPDCIVADESHHLYSDNCTPKAAAWLKGYAGKLLQLSASLAKFDDTVRSLNPEFSGVIQRLSAREALELGYITDFDIIELLDNEKFVSFTESLTAELEAENMNINPERVVKMARGILKSFDEYSEVFDQNYRAAFPFKAMVCATSIDEIDVLCRSVTFQARCKEVGLEIFKIYSGSEERDKQEESFKHIHSPAVIFNIKVLLEGIDVPSMTAVIIASGMAPNEVQQSVGRSRRVLQFRWSAWSHDIIEKRAARVYLVNDAFTNSVAFDRVYEALKMLKNYDEFLSNFENIKGIESDRRDDSAEECENIGQDEYQADIDMHDLQDETIDKIVARIIEVQRVKSESNFRKYYRRILAKAPMMLKLKLLRQLKQLT